jgi:hypothetical protein
MQMLRAAADTGIPTLRTTCGITKPRTPAAQYRQIKPPRLTPSQSHVYGDVRRASSNATPITPQRSHRHRNCGEPHKPGFTKVRVDSALSVKLGACEMHSAGA